MDRITLKLTVPELDGFCAELHKLAALFGVTY